MLFRNTTNLKPPSDIFIDEGDTYEAEMSEVAYTTLDEGIVSIQTELDLSTVPTEVTPKKTNARIAIPKTKLGTMLREERLRLGLTHQQVSDRIGILRRRVAKIEQGIPPVPKIEIIMLFVDFYKMDKKEVKKILDEQKALYSKNSLGTSVPEKPIKELANSKIGQATNKVLDSALNSSTGNAPQINKLFTITRVALLRKIIATLRLAPDTTIAEIAKVFGWPITHLEKNKFTYSGKICCPICAKNFDPNKFIEAKLNSSLLEGTCESCGTAFSVNISKTFNAKALK
jgi:transcriptional regulator with XRE-family HTH domain